MKNSLILLGFFALGIGAGRLEVVPGFLSRDNFELYVLYALLFFVGIGVGSDTRALRNILRLHVLGLAIPLAVACGSLAGAAAVSLGLAGISVRDGLAVGAGFGYYSLSSILISQIKGEMLGIIALLSNIFREVLTILLVPLLARYFGKLAPIASGGATCMDTTLPVIHRHLGPRYAVLAAISGIVLTMLVPVLVPLLL
ncbi:MAG: lysine exporter LysO family protein [Thermodesulfobacteriota bacterium]